MEGSTNLRAPPTSPTPSSSATWRGATATRATPTAAAENGGAARGGTLRGDTPEDFFRLPAAGGGAAGGVAARRAAAAATARRRRRRSARAPRCSAATCAVRGCSCSAARGRNKSFFCERLLEESSLGAAAPEWIVVCQDTAPGKKRDAVERAARDALRRGCSVVVDRMHLTADQRAHFVAIATECAVPCHALLLAPPLAEMESRVRHRTDHPGNVEGERGVGVLRGSAKKTTPPRYAEGFELVSVAHRPADALAYARLYAAAGAAPAEEGAPCACGAGPRRPADVEDREESRPQVLQVLLVPVV